LVIESWAVAITPSARAGGQPARAQQRKEEIADKRSKQQGGRETGQRVGVQASCGECHDLGRLQPNHLLQCRKHIIQTRVTASGGITTTDRPRDARKSSSLQLRGTISPGLRNSDSSELGRRR